MSNIDKDREGREGKHHSSDTKQRITEGTPSVCATVTGLLHLVLLILLITAV